MSYSPEQNAQAISQGYTGYEDYLNNNPQGRSSGGGGGGSWNGGEVFNAAKSALQQRYDSLIQGIKAGTEKQITRQTTTTNNEMGKRGILPSSGLAQQEMTNALNPINEAASAQMASAGADFNTGMANLALGQYNAQQTAEQNAIQNALREREMKLNEQNTASIIADRNKVSSGGGGGGLDLSILSNYLGGTGGGANTTTKNQVKSGWEVVAPSNNLITPTKPMQSLERTPTSGQSASLNTGSYNAPSTNNNPISWLMNQFKTPQLSKK